MLGLAAPLIAQTFAARAAGGKVAHGPCVADPEEMAGQLEPHGRELRLALRQAEGALHVLARMTACGVVNTTGTTLPADQQVALARLRDTAHNGLRFIRAAQEDARKHDLIPSV